MVYFLFASHGALGTLAALSLVPPRMTGASFPRLVSAVALFFLLTGLLASGGLSAAGFPRVPAFPIYALALLPTAGAALLRGERERTRQILLGLSLGLTAAAFLTERSREAA